MMFAKKYPGPLQEYCLLMILLKCCGEIINVKSHGTQTISPYEIASKTMCFDHSCYVRHNLLVDTHQLLIIDFSLPYFKGDYGVVITGPSAAVKVGDAVELNCIVRPNVHLPYSLKVTRNLRLLFTSRSVRNVTLPMGEKKKGIQMLKHRVRLHDAGLYTCEAHWNGPNRAENDSYRLNITGEFLLSVYIVQI